MVYKNNDRPNNRFLKASRGGESASQDSKNNEAVLAYPLEVKVYNNNFDRALRAFRALVQKERVLSLYKEKQSYEKPSQKRRRKRNEMRRKSLELESFSFKKSNKKESFQE